MGRIESEESTHMANVKPTLNIRTGPAGWLHPHWQGVIYPKVAPKGFHPLEFLAKRFDTVEINTNMHQPLRPELSHMWLDKAACNPNFQFTARLARQFTHDRSLEPQAVTQFCDGLRPLQKAGKLGAVAMQFPWAFRYTEENREFFIKLRRAFSEFPLVAEFRHASWMLDEALGTLIDYRVGFVNIDQSEGVKAMPPTSFLTTAVGYVRLNGRQQRNWFQDFGAQAGDQTPVDYLYGPAELAEWKQRIEHITKFAPSTYVIFNNDGGGRSVVNALQMQAMLKPRVDVLMPAAA